MTHETNHTARDLMVERIAENSSNKQKLEPLNQTWHFQFTWETLLLFVVGAGLGYIVSELLPRW